MTFGRRGQDRQTGRAVGTRSGRDSGTVREGTLAAATQSLRAPQQPQGRAWLQLRFLGAGKRQDLDTGLAPLLPARPYGTQRRRVAPWWAQPVLGEADPASPAAATYTWRGLC